MKAWEPEFAVDGSFPAVALATSIALTSRSIESVRKNQIRRTRNEEIARAVEQRCSAGQDTLWWRHAGQEPAMHRHRVQGGIDREDFRAGQIDRDTFRRPKPGCRCTTANYACRRHIATWQARKPQNRRLETHIKKWRGHHVLIIVQVKCNADGAAIEPGIRTRECARGSHKSVTKSRKYRNEMGIRILVWDDSKSTCLSDCSCL
jgi:hypothetical protein